MKSQFKILLVCVLFSGLCLNCKKKESVKPKVWVDSFKIAVSGIEQRTAIYQQNKPHQGSIWLPKYNFYSKYSPSFSYGTINYGILSFTSALVESTKDFPNGFIDHYKVTTDINSIDFGASTFELNDEGLSLLKINHKNKYQIEIIGRKLLREAHTRYKTNQDYIGTYTIPYTKFQRKPEPKSKNAAYEYYMVNNPLSEYFDMHNTSYNLEVSFKGNK